MTWTTYPYCTLTQVKNALGLPSTDTDDDAWIQNDLIPQSQEFIDEYLGYSFQTNGTIAAPITNQYDGTDGLTLAIDYCQSLVQVIETLKDVVLQTNGIYSISTTQTTDITADCYMGPANFTYGYWLKRISGLPFSIGSQNYVIKGVWGRTPIPYKITRACIRLTAHFYKMRDTNYADTISEQNSVRMRYKKNAPDDVIEILDQHRRRRFG